MLSEILLNFAVKCEFFNLQNMKIISYCFFVLLTLESCFSGSTALINNSLSLLGDIRSRTSGPTDANEQLDLGLRYYKGLGVTVDESEATKWFTRSAMLGYTPAQYALGSRYYNGIGVPVDKSEAERWYKKAATYGDANACNDLAWMYQEQKRYEEALPFIDKALKSEPNNANFIDTLAMIYKGLRRDAEAKEQFERALKIAEQENRNDIVKSIKEHMQTPKVNTRKRGR